MRIGKVMHRDVQIIGPKESLRNAAALMKKLDAGALPVSEHDKLIGLAQRKPGFGIVVHPRNLSGFGYRLVRRFRAKPDKKIVDGQAASPSSWKTPFIATCMVW